MSLARTALRLATLEALRPTASIASDGPWPTIARKAVFDSRIDLLEAQIRFACFYGPTGKLWRSVTHRKVTDPRSVPQRTSEEAVRLAMRRVTWRTEVLDDCFDPAPETAPVGLAIVPEPLRG